MNGLTPCHWSDFLHIHTSGRAPDVLRSSWSTWRRFPKHRLYTYKWTSAVCHEVKVSKVWSPPVEPPPSLVQMEDSRRQEKSDVRRTSSRLRTTVSALLFLHLSVLLLPVLLRLLPVSWMFFPPLLFLSPPTPPSLLVQSHSFIHFPVSTGVSSQGHTCSLLLDCLVSLGIREAD